MARTTVKAVTPISVKAGAAAPTAAHSTDMRGRKSARQQRPRVGWYASILIMMTLLLGAGWELWRWILLVITLD